MPWCRCSVLVVLVRPVSVVMLLSFAGLALTIVGVTPRTAMAVADSPVPVPADVQLQVGDTVTLDGGALQVSLVQVVEDSRCPANVMCVSAGRGFVDLRVAVDGVDKGDVTASLVPSPEGQRPPDLDAIVERYVFSLIDLQPYPRAGQAQPLDQRLATIHVAMGTP